VILAVASVSLRRRARVQDKQRIGLIPTTDYTDYKRISQRLNSKPKTVSSKPKTVSSKPKTVSSKPKTVSSKPKTVSSKPKTVSSKPKTVNSKQKTILCHEMAYP
jgi:hypothetical protein